MQHCLYVARDRDSTPLAALGIGVGTGRLGTTFCRWALLLPHRPTTPRLHELTGLPDGAEELRALAVRQATCEARSRQRFIVARDFALAPWWVLQRWVVAGMATREALAAVAEHLGNAEAFDWLRGPATPEQQRLEAAHD